MCGIAVDIDARGREAMPWASDLLAHRGPDGKGFFRDAGRAAIEHRRLAIIDPLNVEADQPFVDRTGRWVLAFNGEIFNYRALRADLESRGIQFRTDSDTEVLLAGFIEFGEAIVQDLRGMFAFVVYDRATGDLFAARDHIGVKPLYYFAREKRFVAASELRAMLAHPLVAPVLDPEGVVAYLAFGGISGGRTLVHGVHALPPGHLLWFRDGVLDVREYWDVIDPEVEVGSASVDELFDRLEDAVASSLVSDVPVGLMLSGGLDSSAIAAIAVRHRDPGSMTAYSVAFGQRDDEAEAAGELARELGVRHRIIHLSRAEIASWFDEWLGGMDVPTADPTWIAVSAIAAAAHEDGIKVLLSGDGGDELFGGYNRWMTYLRFHDRVWRRTPPRMRAVGGRLGARWLSGLSGDIARRAASGGELFVGSRPFHDDSLRSVLGAEGLDAMVRRPPESHVQELHQRFHERLPSGDYLSWMSYASLKTNLVEDYLARLDKEGMRHSVEGRVPLLDPELARWAFTLSQEQKIGRYRQKALFRRTVAPVLPSFIVNRPKQGFCPPVAAWAEDLMRHRRKVVGGALTATGILEPRLSGRTFSGTAGPFATWTLGTLAAWCDHNL